MTENNNSNSFFEEDDQTAWMVTYADLMTLLLVFFVLLFSISSLNIDKFRETLSTIKIDVGTEKPAKSLLEYIELPEALQTEMTLERLTGLKPDAKRSTPALSRSPDYSVEEDIKQFLAQKGLGDFINLEAIDGKLILRVKGKVLFPSGSAKLRKEAWQLLDEIIVIFKEYAEFQINIKGHTDNVPIRTRQFPSNWELSAIRATTILKYLIEKKISPKRLTATGYGSLMPVVPNNSRYNRAINRRVEFVLEKANTDQQYR